MGIGGTLGGMMGNYYDSSVNDVVDHALSYPTDQTAVIDNIPGRGDVTTKVDGPPSPKELAHRLKEYYSGRLGLNGGNVRDHKMTR